MKEQVEKITHIEHILKRPDSYVGSTSRSKDAYWILNKDGTKFDQKNITYSPALLKIFDEILVNAIDRNSVYPKDVKTINVAADLELGVISVENNGPLGGICIQKHPKENIWNPELTFGHLLTSTNYDDNKQRVVGGRNGYGAKLTNIYSSLFQVTIPDSENKVKYVQQWTNNMTTCGEAKITKYSGATSKVSIAFVPDWKRFGMTKMDKDFFSIIQKRVWDAVMCTSDNCVVSFQGSKLKKMPMESYAKMYLDDDTKVASAQCDRWQVVVAPSDSGFQQVSFVNGICTTKGGTHVDYVASQICAGVIEALGKKIKLRPQHVKNTLFVMVRATLVNPTFSSQIKSECTLKPQEFGSAFKPPSTFIKSVLKSGVQDEVMAVSQFREQKELKKSDGSKRSKITGIPKLDDANFAGTVKSEKCTLIVTEGDSASGSITKARNVETQAVFSLRGKPLNTFGSTRKVVYENEEFNLLQAALDIENSLDNLRYNKVVLATDADVDGMHIRLLLLTFFLQFFPDLIREEHLFILQTPLFRVRNKKETRYCYTEDERLQAIEDLKPNPEITRFKGLGEISPDEFKGFINKDIRLEPVIMPPTPRAIEDLLTFYMGKNTPERQQYIIKNLRVETDLIDDESARPRQRRRASEGAGSSRA